MDGPNWYSFAMDNCKKNLTKAERVISSFFQSSAAFSHGKLTEIFILNCTRVTKYYWKQFNYTFLNVQLGPAKNPFSTDNVEKTYQCRKGRVIY